MTFPNQFQLHFCQLHFETVCKSMMSVYFIGKCAAITQLSLGTGGPILPCVINYVISLYK